MKFKSIFLALAFAASLHAQTFTLPSGTFCGTQTTVTGCLGIPLTYEGQSATIGYRHDATRGTGYVLPGGALAFLAGSNPNSSSIVVEDGQPYAATFTGIDAEGHQYNGSIALNVVLTTKCVTGPRGASGCKTSATLVGGTLTISY